MSGKLFLLALVCASSVQVWGSTEKDEKIKKAITEIDQITFTVYWDTNDFSLYTRYMLAEYKAKTEKYLNEARKESANLHKFLQDTALFLKEEAKASNKPQSVFFCIDKVREKFNEKNEKLTTKHKTEVIFEQIAFEEKGKTVNEEAHTLFSAAYYERHNFKDRFLSLKEISDVDMALTYYKHWWRATIYAWREKLRDDLSLLPSTYDAKVERSFRTYKSEMIMAKSQSADEMWECLHKRQAISEKSTFLNLITMQ